ncbi:MAG: aldo/keto reductase [Bacteroides sp.]|nr:aldo/keto reductase [Bacteroides sp.]
MNTFQLNDGREIPALGLGTWKTPADDTATKVVEFALTHGYSLVDCAAYYANEAEIGEGIRLSGVSRDKLFLTSKLWNTDRGYDSTLTAFEESLQKLGTDYLDLYLIHWPATMHQFADWKSLNAETWRAMERLVTEGRVRSIGVCNFKPSHLEALLETAVVTPAVNQIECHPGWFPKENISYCHDHGIRVMAWAPLGRGALAENPTMLGIAEAHSKTVAQVSLRWEYQHGIVSIPKSVNEQRLLQNLDIFDIQLSDEEMHSIDTLPVIGYTGKDPDTIDF